MKKKYKDDPDISEINFRYCHASVQTFQYFLTASFQCLKYHLDINENFFCYK